MAASNMRGCSNGGVAIHTASISGPASTFSTSLYLPVFCDLMVVSDLSNWSGNLSQSAITRARGSACTMLASYEPRPPQPIRPTAICELACEPLTDCGATIVKAPAAVAAPDRNLRRVSVFMMCAQNDS